MVSAVRFCPQAPAIKMFILFFNQLDAQKLFDFPRIFESTPDPQGLYQYLSFVFGLLLIVALIIFLTTKKQKSIIKNYFNRIINLLLFIGVAGLILIFCRWQGIPYLGSRLIFYLLLIVFIVWGGFVVWFRIFIFPKKMAKLREREQIEKYLPRRQAGLPKKRKEK